MKKLPLSLAALLLTLGSNFNHAGAEVKLPRVFGDHMILQRDIAAPVWGTADPGEEVIVEFSGQKKFTSADPAGKWMVKLDPIPASATPGVLYVTGKNKLLFQDVLVGDVWLASGQSNMGSPLASAHNAAEALPQAGDPSLRFFNVAKKTAAEPQPDVEGKWELSTPDSAKNFSAVAYFFAREIRRTQNVPVAIVHSSWGGTPIQIWLSLESIKKDPPLTKTLDQWNAALAQHQAAAGDPQLAGNYLKDQALWETEVSAPHKAALKEYNDAVAAGKPVGPKPQPARLEPVNPDPIAVTAPSKRPQIPTTAFNATIAPIVPYALRGVIWYQGEQNGGAGLEYRDLFPRLIEDWRGQWKQGDFPFLFVQLPSNGADAAPVATSGWPWLREAQFMTLNKVPNTGMATTIDIGDPKNVHPANKVDVGQRLALLGRKLAYGESLVAFGPLYQDCAVQADGTVQVRFRETGGGLVIGQSPWYAPGVEPFPTDKLIGFFIAGEDKKWVEAEAKIEGADTVVVSNPQVPKPTAVRYGWANSPRCNLYNKEGLPAATFRTDDWPK